ncbi:hypothetical protein H1P_1650014 [Hyella patelloides LEGE 07179]|uniref:Uncharacterized protein n=1 Tax=Hyella patelloides LEGE 07179 TaxID=945734 RepID=A0A563VN09_9CYAN|nr:YwiC-like family protein [Hyella patelloides]VEP12792.1 hypothetical protein H1P_1650014 [Hyella patelloides LEGE 07179]
MTPHRVADLFEIAIHSPSPKSQQWYRPTVSPEHGVYVMLMVSFLTGAAAAQQWSWQTTPGSRLRLLWLSSRASTGMAN